MTGYTASGNANSGSLSVSVPIDVAAGASIRDGDAEPIQPGLRLRQALCCHRALPTSALEVELFLPHALGVPPPGWARHYCHP